MSTIIVAGAGMVGVGSALALQADGHEVILIDRRAPGEETSYGNAGLIQREAIEPYAFPSDARMLLDVVMGRSTAVNHSLGTVVSEAPRLAAYWQNSQSASYERICAHYRALIEHCLDDHAPLIAAAGVETLMRRTGFLSVYRTQRLLDEAVKETERLQRNGVDARVLDGAGLRAVEPGLGGVLLGGIHWAQPWACQDPGALVAAYARLFEARGGTVVRDEITNVAPTTTGWTAQGITRAHDAEHLVLSLGPWARNLVQRLGYNLPLFVKRGYHRHYRFERALTRPVMDGDGGYVLAPMRQGVRLTTGAEFAKLGAPATPRQIEQDEPLAAELLGACTPLESEPWLGNRPCTTDMLPVTGAAHRHRGLWFNFGHGHQGFTLGPTSGRMLADLIAGRAPVADPTPYSPARFD